MEVTFELPMNLESQHQFQVTQVYLSLLLLSGENPNSIRLPSSHFINQLLLSAHPHLPCSSFLLKVGVTGYVDITSELVSNAEF